MTAGRLVMVNVRGKALDGDQRAFLQRHDLRAVVLFRENLGTEAEVRNLVADLRATLGERALIAIDQEGGAVVRWRSARLAMKRWRTRSVPRLHGDCEAWVSTGISRPSLTSTTIPPTR
jgi:beta-glucosidase-like glycosyl hydrolase